MTLVYISIFIVIFAIFNAYVILWQQDIGKNRLLWSKIWHSVGRVVIGVVVLWEWYNTSDQSLWWLYFLTCFNLSWTIWDLVINAIRKINGTNISWLHGHKGVNTFVYKLFLSNSYIYWGVRFLLLALNIGLLIYF